MLPSLSGRRGSAGHPPAFTGGLGTGSPAHPDEIPAHGCHCLPCLRQVYRGMCPKPGGCAGGSPPGDGLAGKDNQQPPGDLLHPAFGGQQKVDRLAAANPCKSNGRLLSAAHGEPCSGLPVGSGGGGPGPLRGAGGFSGWPSGRVFG